MSYINLNCSSRLSAAVHNCDGTHSHSLKRQRGGHHRMPEEVVRITGRNTLTRLLLHEGVEYTEEEWRRKLLNDRLDRIIALLERIAERLERE
jgi:hypothetical protein